MHADRLRRLAFYLRNDIKDEVFNLATWVGNDDVPWEGKDDLSCGTSACAMGWATTIPEFKQLGLHLERFSPSGQGFLVFGEAKHFEAAAQFMDISLKEAEYLFDPAKYPEEDDTSRLEVVERIEDFITNGMDEDDYHDFHDDDDEPFDDEEYEDDEEDEELY